jgi:hypothetical protein
VVLLKCRCALEYTDKTRAPAQVYFLEVIRVTFRGFTRVLIAFTRQKSALLGRAAGATLPGRPVRSSRSRGLWSGEERTTGKDFRPIFHATFV